MANVIKLKRSSTASKTPQLSDLTLGELAMNTFDGKLFFLKDNGTQSIQSIVTTNTQITGSVELTGAVTSSYSLVSNNSPVTDMFIVKVSGEERIKVNSEGTFIINQSTDLPTGNTGALAMSGSSFFIYI